jgi:hypothetical protein
VVRPKISDHVTTPPGTANSIQGTAVLGYSGSDAVSHPVITWVTR